MPADARAGRTGRLAPARVVRATSAVAASLLGDSMLYAVLPSSMDAFGLPPGAVGLLLSANRFVRLGSNALAARAYLRFGLAQPFASAVALASLTTLAYGLARGLAPLLAARLLWGACYSLLRLGGQLVVLEEGPRQERGRLMGFFNGGQRVGSVVAVVLGGFLFDRLGRETSFTVVALLTLMGLPLALGLWQRGGPSPAPPGATTAPRPRPEPAPSLWRLALYEPSLPPGRRWHLAATGLLAFSIYLTVAGLVTATLGYYLRAHLGPGVRVLGLGLGVATVTGLALALRWAVEIAGPYLGMLSDRWGRAPVVMGAVPVALLALLALALAPGVALGLALLPLLFLGGSLSVVTLDALAGDLAPRGRRPQVMARYATWQDLGSALGPLAGYALLEVTTLQVVYTVAGGLLAVAYLAFWWSARRA